METMNHKPERRVLVTGATGFVGRPCLDRLVAGGWQIIATTSNPAATSVDGIDWRLADFHDTMGTCELVREVQPTHLLHLAWANEPDGAIYRSRQNYGWVAASLNLLQFFADYGGRRAVFVGTGAEYDWSDGLCSESTTPLNPGSTYGLCKRALGELFVDFANQGLPGGGGWARLFFLIGPHDAPKRLIASVIRSILRGEPARCSHGRQLRDYLFTLDAADGLVTLLESDVNGPINVAAGEASQLGQLIRRTAALMGREDLVELGAIPVPEDDPPRVVADVGRLQRELGWRPSWQLDDALEHTIRWWRSQTATEEAP